MLFTHTIRSWRDWSRVFQSIPAFTPLAREICRREGLPWAELTPLTPGTNGVFRCGEAVLKIFFPKESGLDPALDFSTELAAAQQAASWGVPTPPVLAHGCLQDKYRFYYIATQYSPGERGWPLAAGRRPCPAGGLCGALAAAAAPSCTGPPRPCPAGICGRRPG